MFWFLHHSHFSLLRLHCVALEFCCCEKKMWVSSLCLYFVHHSHFSKIWLHWVVLEFYCCFRRRFVCFLCWFYCWLYVQLNHAKKDDWYLTQDKHGKEPVDERFFNPELIFFEGDVTKGKLITMSIHKLTIVHLAERKLAMKHLYGFKKRIDEKVNTPWDDIPILVTKNEWRASSEQGFLTIPVHITVSKFIDYLNTYLPSIR